ncbi:restriction endonuclease [Streptomyces sp. SP2-10]|uniref:restriction endonuclease n=1 Tax=Streptomyces sp. SP2-10 TaxID=2873385 RepID=UPI0027DF8D8E|nr:restriction endonuclease [Streptomyces sp. SP2-10]
MTIPVRRDRGVERGRRFDLRTTAMFFLLLAIILCVVAFLARTAAGIVERRPLWAGVLAVLGVAATLRFRSRWRRLSAGRCARRAGRALEEAAEKASASLGGTAAGEAVVPTVRTGAASEPVGDAAPADPGRDEYRVPPEPVPSATVPLHPGGAGNPVGPGTGAGHTGLDPDAEAGYAELDTDAGAGYAELDPNPEAGYAELDPDGFEQAVAELCVRDDCREVEVVGGAGDLGADVVAVAPDGRRVVIQCKHYGDPNKVGSQDMQRFGGTCFTIHEADVAAVVTTSDFTAPALEYARQCGIVCVNGDDLAAWHRGAGPSPWHRPAGES